MGKKSKQRAKKPSQSEPRKASSISNEVLASRDASEAAKKDPPIEPLSKQEEDNLPELLKDFFPFSETNSLQKLASHLGVTIVEVNMCIACQGKKDKSDFTRNQWISHNQWSPQCRKCIKQGRFMVSSGWFGCPKCPLQILWDRGWINWPRGVGVPDPRVYLPDRISKIVLAMLDHEFLLENFELAGHYGYSGLEEELCCMPGCVQAEKLQTCARCNTARYCCKEHQQLHYFVHKAKCQALANSAKSLMLE